METSTGAQSALFYNVTRSIDTNLPVGSNIAMIPFVANAALWGSNVATFASNQMSSQVFTDASITVAMNDLELKLSQLSNNVNQLLSDNTTLTETGSWLLSTCVFSSNKIGQLVGNTIEQQRLMYVIGRLNSLNEFLLSHRKY